MKKNIKDFLTNKISPKLKKVKNILKGIWLTKPLVKFSVITNGFGLVTSVNKLVKAPLPTICESINLLTEYYGLQNSFGLNQMIFLQDFLIPSLHLACMCSLALFIVSFGVLLVLHLRSDKDLRNNSYEKLKKIPMSKYMEITFISSQLGLAGFLGTITIKTLIVVASNDSLYNPQVLYKAQLDHTENERIFRIMGIIKTKKLKKSINIIMDDKNDILNNMLKYKRSRLVTAYKEFPKILKPRPGKSYTNLLQRECNKRLKTFVAYENLLEVMDLDIILASEETRDYFIAAVAYYAYQLRNCYKLLP